MITITTVGAAGGEGAAYLSGAPELNLALKGYVYLCDVLCAVVCIYIKSFFFGHGVVCLLI